MGSIRADVPGPAPAGPAVDRLRGAGAGWRLLLVPLLAALFVAGALVGDDPWWPFGPWRMFSTSTPPSGAVVYLSIEVRTVDGTGWQQAPLRPETVGLNRAEIEGRVPQIVRDPSLLGTLVRSHARLRPREPAWTAVRVVRTEALLKDRRPTGETVTRVVASWPTP